MTKGKRMTKVYKAVHELVLEGKTPPKDIAKTIGKPYSTLMRELNPHDRLAKLGVDTFMDIMKCTGNLRPLEIMAGELGCKVVPAE